MSTNATIIVRVRKEDSGKKMKFDPSKLPSGVRERDWKYLYDFGFSDDTKTYANQYDGEGTEQEIELKDGFLAIYVHWDGDDAVKACEKTFTSYEEALNLVLGGFCSWISNVSIRRYAKRYCDGKPMDDWEYICPKFFNTKEEAIEWYDNPIYAVFDGEWEIHLR